MLQLQYFNSKLKNKHINSILDNYKLKYSGIKTELSSKLNELIKLFLSDILSFLENTEEIANTKKKVNNYEKMKNELETVRVQLKIKMLNEQKIKNDLETLTQENSLLKVKIKSLNQKLNTIYSNNTNNKVKSKSPFVSKGSKDINANVNNTFTKINLRGSVKNDNSDFRKKFSSSIDRKTMLENSINKLDLSLTSKFDYSSKVLEKLEKSNSKNNKKINSKRPNYLVLRKSNLKKEQNSFYKNTTNEINSKEALAKKRKNIKKFLMNKNNSNKTSTSNLKACTPFSPFPPNSMKKKLLENKDSNLYSLNNSREIGQVNNTEYEDIEKKINNAIDNELKQLEQDEENIKKLLEKINNGNSSNEINNINENNIGLTSMIDESN